MKAMELRKKSMEELRALLRETSLRREELVLLLRQRKVKNVRELRAVKRAIARLHTIMREAKP